MVGKTWQNIGVISSGYTVCKLDTSYEQVTYSILQSMKEAGTSTDYPALSTH